MNPQLVKKLLENIDIKEFVAFIQEEIFKLNTLDGLNLFNNEDKVIEVTARLRAKEKLEAILDPLLNTNTNISGGSSNKEFVV